MAKDKRNKDSRDGDIMVITMIASAATAVAGTVTNAIGITDIPWWIIGIIGAPFALIILTIVLGILSLIWQANRYG